MKTRIGVLGGGPLGLTVAVGWVERGYDVTLVEPSPDRFQEITKDTFISYEQDLNESFRNAKRGNRLEISRDLSKLGNVDFLHVCIENQDLLWTMVQEIEPVLSKGTCLILKSTVSVGTADDIQHRFDQKKKGVEVISNPEFLRKGKTLTDLLNPTRIILGGDGNKPGMKTLRTVLAQDSLPIMVTTRKNAEMIKLASNAFLAAKISFINQMAQICEELGADIQTVSRGMGLDPRIGQAFLGAGIGFGGPGLPEAMEVLIKQAEQHQVSIPMLEAVMVINHQQSEWIIKKLREQLGSLQEKTLAVWGVAFKGGTDDISQSVSVDMLEILLREKANLQIYDPAGLSYLEERWLAEGVFQRHGTQITMSTRPLESVDKASALLILTDWQEFKEVNLVSIKEQMQQPLMIDGRNLFPPEMMEEIGFRYISVGRKV